jgi:hypothetical protein
MTEHPDSGSADSNLLGRFSAAASNRTPGSAPRRCINHQDREGLYYCRQCDTWRCKTCARTFESVAICVDCDSLAIHAIQFDQMSEASIEKARPYSWRLLQAVTYPFRHFIFTAGACLSVLLSAALAHVLTDAGAVIPLQSVLTGPMVGWTGNAIAFAVAGAIAMNRLIVRVDGEESLRWEKIQDFSVIGDPVAFWIAAAFIGVVPLTVYLWFYKLKLLLLALVIGMDEHALDPQPSVGRWIMIVLLSTWSAFFYPMAFVTAAVRKSVTAILNPIASIWGWISFKQWLIPPFAMSFVLAGLTFAIAYLFGNQPYGLLIYSCSLVFANLIAAQALAAAVCEGSDKVDLEGVFKIKVPEQFDRVIR